MKKGIRYLRYSSDGQSNSSIERQELYTKSWFERNDVTIVDTFTDEGYSARTFDRPDFKKLQDFIAKNHRFVDYLVVDQMDRFSRDAGDALTMIKKLQKDYAIQIVSANDGLIYDHNTPGSLLRTGLQFLLAEENNIDRMQKIRGGIYTAKAKEGRYIGAKIPFGYSIEGKGKARGLVINPLTAPTIRYIFEAFLNDVPIQSIRAQARKMGYIQNGHSLIPIILKNPIYTGHQAVKEHKHMPGGLFPALHEAIIPMHTWQRVQEKLTRGNQKVVLNDAFHLRGLLKCHCTLPLTAYTAKNRLGSLYDYYKCPGHSAHNHFSATTAHTQLQEILQLLSLPDYMIRAIDDSSRKALKETQAQNVAILKDTKKQLEQKEEQLFSLEKKFIANQIPHETFQRWYNDLTNDRINLKAKIEHLSRDADEIWLTLVDELEKLTDLKNLYNSISLTNKQTLLKLVFEHTLYYQNSAFRTRSLIPTFRHNIQKMKEKQLLFIDGWDYKNGLSPFKLSY